jgi:SAM-dependent methyltransferase
MMENQLYENTYRSEQSHWWFVGRRTLVFDQIERCYPHRTDLQMMDVGCGTGLNMKSLARYGDVTGVDLSSLALEFCRTRGHARLVRAPIERLPFADNSFDLVTALDIIEHLDDDVAGIREIWRVLKPGGRVFVLVPAYKFLWSLQDEVSSHRRRYVRAQLRAALRCSGLTVERATYANTLLFPVVLFGRMALKVVRRYNTSLQNENGLHPGWSNEILKAIFKAEAPLLRAFDAPFGVSILAIAKKAG